MVSVEYGSRFPARGVPPQKAESLRAWNTRGGRGPVTRCHRLGPEYWIVREGYGSLRFSENHRKLRVHVARGVDPEEFRRRFVAQMIPAICSYWGWQTLHASGALHVASGRAVAFSGRSRSGKSTLAYALGQRSGWRQFADEAVVFAVEDRQARLVPVPNYIRLRAPTAEHFVTRSGGGRESLAAPAPDARLSALYFLDGPDGHAGHTTITPLAGLALLQRLLRQALTLLLDTGDQKRRFTEGYCELVRCVRGFDLAYPRRFEALGAVLDRIEAHLLAA